MSIKVMTDVWSKSKTKGSKLLLLLAIADNANEDRIAWPGVRYLADKIRMDRRTVQRLIKELEDLGELGIIYGGGRGNSHLYHVLTGLPEIERARIKADIMASNIEAGYLDEDLNGGKLTPPREDLNGGKKALNGGKKALNGGKKALNGGVAMPPESLTYSNHKNNIKDKTREDPYYRYWLAIIDQVRLEIGENSRFYRLLENDIIFIGYDPELNKLTLEARDEDAREIYNGRLSLTVGRLYAGTMGVNTLDLITVMDIYSRNPEPAEVV